MKIIFSLLSACILLATSTQAAIVFGNLGSDGSAAVDPSEGGALSLTTWYAVGFNTAPTSSLLYVQSITLGLESEAPISTSISLWSGTASGPSSLLHTSTSQTVSGTGAKYTFVFSSALLATSSTYWVVLATPDISWVYDASFSVPSEQNASGYSFVNAVRTTNGGASWGNAPTDFYAVSIDATAAPVIPEPGTWAAAALLLGAAGYVRWRRRQAAQ